jgi:hypothetical protein
LPVNREMNLLSLISLWLDNNYQITTKVLQYPNQKILETEQGQKFWELNKDRTPKTPCFAKRKLQNCWRCSKLTKLLGNFVSLTKFSLHLANMQVLHRLTSRVSQFANSLETQFCDFEKKKSSDAKLFCQVQIAHCWKMLFFSLGIWFWDLTKLYIC